MSELIETYRTASGREFVVLRGGLGGEVLWNVGGDWVEGWSAFTSEFEIDSEDYLGDPAEDHYQGTLFTRLIRRKADGAVFGAQYWYNPGIDSVEGSYAGSGTADEMGLEGEDEDEEPVVFFPVTGFLRVGYSLDKLALND